MAIHQLAHDPSLNELLVAGFGLSTDHFSQVVHNGFLARGMITRNHPVTYGGMVQWAETVRLLRDIGATSGWETRNPANYPLCVNDKRSCAIAVSSGNFETGVAEGTPCNRLPKGRLTEDAVLVNQQLSLFSQDEMPLPENSDLISYPTWLLLYYIDRTKSEIRFELSLPTKMAAGKIVGWQQRYIFPPIPIDAALTDQDYDDGDTGEEIDVEVKPRF